MIIIITHKPTRYLNHWITGRYYRTRIAILSINKNYRPLELAINSLFKSFSKQPFKKPTITLKY